MSSVSLLSITVFLTSVGIGVAVHEGAHGIVLRYYGYNHEYNVGLGEGDRLIRRAVDATVSVEWSPFNERARGVELTVAALAPLAIFLPALVVIGLELISGLAYYAVTGILVASVPSPQDFGLAWRGMHGWDDYVMCGLEALANHEAAEGYPSVLGPDKILEGH